MYSNWGFQRLSNLSQRGSGWTEPESSLALKTPVFSLLLSLLLRMAIRIYIWAETRDLVWCQTIKSEDRNQKTFFKKTALYWSIVAVQCCVSFCWISHLYACISSFSDFLPTMSPWSTEEFPLLYRSLSLVPCFRWLLPLSCVQLFCHLMDCTCQAPLSLGFSRQGYWRGLPFPSSGDLPSLGIRSTSLALQADSSLLNHWGNSYFTRSITSVYLQSQPPNSSHPSFFSSFVFIHLFSTSLSLE